MGNQHLTVQRTDLRRIPQREEHVVESLVAVANNLERGVVRGPHVCRYVILDAVKHVPTQPSPELIFGHRREQSANRIEIHGGHFKAVICRSAETVAGGLEPQHGPAPEMLYRRNCSS